MISYLCGKLINKSSNYVIVNVNNIGYAVFVSDNFLNELKVSSEVEIYTHHHIREDADDLYGFKNLADLELFELLISVSGVGPKSALAVLAIASTSDIKESIIRGDADLLTKVSGIGKKTAERLVLELKTKVLKIGGGSDLSSSVGLASSDELDALMSLGYSLGEARNALNSVSESVKDSGERVKQALKTMKK